MHIQPVTSFAVCTLNSAGKASNRHPGYGCQTSFNGWKVDGGAILEMNHMEMKELAEYFHKSPEEVLAQISVARTCIGLKNTEDSMRAYEKLMRFINEIRSERRLLEYSGTNYAVSRLKELNNKAAICREKYYDEPAGFDINDPVDLAGVHWP